MSYLSKPRKADSATDLIRTSSFRLFLSAEFVSSLGSAAAPLGLAFGVFAIGGNATSLSFVLGAQILPVLLTLILGSVWVDRLPRKRILVIANGCSSFVQSLAGALLLMGLASIPILAILAFINGASSSIRLPATYGFLPTLVKDNQLEKANATVKLANNSVAIGGAAIGGLLVAVFGPGWGLILDAGTFLAAAALLAATPTDHRVGSDGKNRGILRELTEGWSEFWAQSWLWPVVLQFTIINVCFFGGYNLLGPVIAERYFDGATSWASIAAANAVGTVIGALVAIKLRPTRPMLFGVVCAASLALPLLGLGFLAPVWVIGLLTLIAGGLFEIFDVQYASTFQRKVPLELMGRVSAYDGLLSFGSLSFGYLIVGMMAGAVGPLSVALVAAAAIPFASGLALCAPGVRGVRRSRESKDSAVIV